MANSTNNLVIVPLGDLDAGTYGLPDDLLVNWLTPSRYSMDAQLSGSVADVKLWDNMGDDVGE